MIHSDWHIHSEYSYDAKNTLELIAENATKQGICRLGITDHANFNDAKFLGDLHASAEACKLRSNMRRILVPQPKNPSRLAWIFSFVPSGTTSFERSENIIAAYGTNERG